MTAKKSLSPSKKKKTLKKRASKKKTKKRKPASDKKKKWEHKPIRTEAEQIAPLSEDLQDAWDRLKQTLTSFGEYKSHTSHAAIMFYRNRCYAFVRPKKKYLETVFFLDEEHPSELLKRIHSDSKTRHGHTIHIFHRDQVEEPLTGWLRKAYDLAE